MKGFLFWLEGSFKKNIFKGTTIGMDIFAEIIL